jgi:hypothetical protein
MTQMESGATCFHFIPSSYRACSLDHHQDDCCIGGQLHRGWRRLQYNRPRRRLTKRGNASNLYLIDDPYSVSKKLFLSALILPYAVVRLYPFAKPERRTKVSRWLSSKASVGHHLCSRPVEFDLSGFPFTIPFAVVIVASPRRWRFIIVAAVLDCRCLSEPFVGFRCAEKVTGAWKDVVVITVLGSKLSRT